RDRVSHGNHTPPVDLTLSLLILFIKGSEGSTAHLRNVIKLRIPQRRGPTFFAEKSKKHKKHLTNRSVCAGALTANFGFCMPSMRPL
ncbi:MAG: hypothetical protein IJL34_09055, partial [Treponema sp.]|nr:hypothetical protein [Treponema sp.]